MNPTPEYRCPKCGCGRQLCHRIGCEGQDKLVDALERACEANSIPMPEDRSALEDMHGVLCAELGPEDVIIAAEIEIIRRLKGGAS